MDYGALDRFFVTLELRAMHGDFVTSHGNSSPGAPLGNRPKRAQRILALSVNARKAMLTSVASTAEPSGEGF